MKRIILISSLVIVAAGIFVLGYFSQNLSLVLHAPRVLARVNGVKITDLDLKRELLFLKVNDGASFSDHTREDILDRMINDALILQEAKRMKIDVPDAEVNSRLAAAREGYSPGEMQRMLGEYQLSMSAWQDLIRRRLLVEATVHKIVEDQVKVSEEEIDAYYWSHLTEYYRPQRVHARQIVVETLAQAQTLKQKITAGEDFQALAAKFSRGPEKDEGGDLGWVVQADLPQAFSRVLFRLHEGEVSDPVATEYGYHLFRVDAMESGGRMAADEAKAKIADELKMEKTDRVFAAWLEDLRSKARISVSDLRGGD